MKFVNSLTEKQKEHRYNLWRLRSWSGEQSYYWGPKCFACKNRSKLCLS